MATSRGYLLPVYSSEDVASVVALRNGLASALDSMLLTLSVAIG